MIKTSQPKKSKKPRPDRQAEDGSAIVEGAMVFGLFFFLIFAIIEFGLFFVSWSTGRNAATEAAHEAAVSGTDSKADFSAINTVRNQLTQMRGSLDYVIIYRAKSITDRPPVECVNEAEAKRIVPPGDELKPVGVFIDDAGLQNVEAFIWTDVPRPRVACNIYYARHLALVDTDFGYNKAAIEGGSTPSADRFWPAPNRVDKLIGPVDLLGVQVSQTYKSATGMIPTRRLRHNSIIQIESRTAQ